MTNARHECANMIDLLRANEQMRDRHPDRQWVSSLEHGLQMAGRARDDGMSNVWVAVALLHDAAKPLTERWHGQAMAEMLREYVPSEVVRYLRNHSDQAYGQTKTPLGKLDAASFDPEYATPSLDEMVPYVETLYGLSRVA